ncbi:MAG: trigger factor [Deltaproteobacteria bacterium RBG_13_65_10]|nr:MAG: trigger factor [Deltaproteobacteria bacterium RBG_13_65_10]
MKAIIEVLGPWERKVVVEVPAEEVGDAVEHAYRHLARRVRVKGFRAGRTPRSVLERLYSDTVRNEVVQRLVDRTYTQAVKEHGLEPVSEPVVEPEKIEEGKPWRYTARLEVKPAVTVTCWQALEIVKPAVNVEEEAVQERLKRLAEMHSQLVTQEESVRLARGHFAIIDYEGTIEGRPFAGGKGSEATLEIGSGSFVPGFEEQLEGMAKGDTREIDVTFPPEYRHEGLAGKRAHFRVGLKEIKCKVTPAMDDDFARDVGEFKTLEALRARVREDLCAELEQEARRDVREQARRCLAAQNPVDAPPALVENEFRSMVEGTRRRLAAQGVSMENLGLTAEALEKEWRPRAEESVKASLLLEQIAREQALAVAPEEVDREIQRIAQESRQSPRAVRSAYEERGLIALLESRLQQEKALDLVLEKATMRDGKRAQGAATSPESGERG